MSKINCNVTQDLLPLYAENMVSNDSKTLVDEHLDECEKCRNELAKINSNVTVKTKTETDFIKGIKKKINRKNLIFISVLLPCLLALIIFFKPFIQQIYYRYLYIGNRIDVAIDLNIDGVKYDIDDISVECVHDDASQKVTLDNDSFSIKADDYGKYIFKINFNDTIVNASFFQANWWNVQNFTLFVDVDTEENSLFYYITGTHIQDDLSKGSYSEKNVVYSQNNTYSINAQII